jgi:hypothetical protein
MTLKYQATNSSNVYQFSDVSYWASSIEKDIQQTCLRWEMGQDGAEKGPMYEERNW